MEFSNTHGWLMKQEARGWYKWFAWYPVDISVDKTIWFGWVERRITGMTHSERPLSATYEYRRVGSTSDGWSNHF